MIALIVKRLRYNLIARCWRLQNKKFIPKYQKTLREILAQFSDCPAVIVFPPGLGWHSQLFQRPQQLAQALAHNGVLVFYMEPEHESLPPGFHAHQDNLFLCHVPIDTFRIFENPLVYTLTWNHKFSSQFHQPRLIYDYVDDISAFVGNQGELTIHHNRLVKVSTLVLATAERLHREVASIRPDAILCPNGVDYDHFAQARISEAKRTPTDLQPFLELNQKVIGYYGAISHWFDFNLMKAVARQRDELSFILIGPQLDNDLSDSGLLDLPNVYWLGVKSYSELPHYVRYFDVAVIPFQLNRITHATSPLKLFEYMAAGKPIVITPMQESMRYQGVLPASNPNEFSMQIDRGLLMATDPTYQDLINRVARQNTWQERAKQILTSLKEKLSENNKLGIISS